MNLNTKIGPLPAKAWAGVGVVGVVGGLYLRSHRSAQVTTGNTSQPITDPNVDPATGQTWAQEAAQQAAAANPPGIGSSGGGFDTGNTGTIDTTQPPTDASQNPSTVLTIQAPVQEAPTLPTNPAHGHYVMTRNGPTLIGFVKGRWRPVGPGTGIHWKHGKGWVEGTRAVNRPHNPPPSTHPNTHRPSTKKRRTGAHRHR